MRLMNLRVIETYILDEEIKVPVNLAPKELQKYVKEHYPHLAVNRIATDETHQNSDYFLNTHYFDDAAPTSRIKLG